MHKSKFIKNKLRKKGKNNFKTRKPRSIPLNSYPVALTKIVSKPQDYLKILSSLIWYYYFFFTGLCVDFRGYMWTKL